VPSPIADILGDAFGGDAVGALRALVTAALDALF